jgi:SNF2 family DNA or RNA helicase
VAQAHRNQRRNLRAQLLAQRVRPFILRRRKEDVAAELPPRTEVIKRVQLQGRQRELYESVRVAADIQVRRVLARNSFAGGQITILDALLKLRQVCCDPYLLKGVKPVRTMGRAKLELLRGMLPELVAEGRRVLVFSQFTGMLSLIEAELGRAAVALAFADGRHLAAKARRAGAQIPGENRAHPAGQPEGRRRRAQPHGCRHRDPCGSLVEPRG